MINASDARRMTDFDARAPFRGATALQHKITDLELKKRRYRRIFHGVYVSAGTKITRKVRARAALLVAGEGASISHHAAARLWDGWATDPATHVSAARDLHRTKRRGLAAHRADPSLTPKRRRGMPIATPTAVFVDLARYGLSLVELVAVGDSLVKAKRVSPQELLAAATNWRGPGCRLAAKQPGWCARVSTRRWSRACAC